MIVLERNACDRAHYSDLTAPYFCINKTLCKFFGGYIFFRALLEVGNPCLGLPSLSKPLNLYFHLLFKAFIYIVVFLILLWEAKSSTKVEDEALPLIICFFYLHLVIYFCHFIIALSFRTWFSDETK